MNLEFIGLLIGIGIIILGAELFIDGLENFSVNLKIPKIIIALTIVAFGTSTPELSISFQGVINNNGELVLANVIGSTIVNSLLIIGIASLINPIKIQSKTVKKELPLHLFVILTFVFLFFDSIFNHKVVNTLTRNDAIFLLLIFFLFFYYLVSLIKNKKDSSEWKNVEKPKYSVKKSIIFSIIGLILIISGSIISVESATLLAETFGWSSKFITMIFIVIGTSIPELITSIVSARKKQYDFIIGNIIGTNIFNFCIVLGLPTLIFGDVSSVAFNIMDMIMLIITGFILFLVAKNDKVISKKEGLIMIFLFCIYYSYVLF